MASTGIVIHFLALFLVAIMFALVLDNIIG